MSNEVYRHTRSQINMNIHSSENNNINTESSVVSNSRDTNLCRQAILEVISAPKITSLDTKYLIEWKLKRVQYENELKERGQEHQKCSLKMSFDPFLLKSFCLLKCRKLPEQCTEHDISTQLSALIHTAADNRTRMSEDEIEKHLHRVQMNMKIICPEARVIEYLGKFEQCTMKSGLNKALYENNVKLLTRCLTNGIRPEGLQKHMKSARMENSLFKKSYPDYILELLKSAIEQNPERFTPWLKIYMAEHANTIFGDDLVHL